MGIRWQYQPSDSAVCVRRLQRVYFVAIGHGDALVAAARVRLAAQHYLQRRWRAGNIPGPTRGCDDQVHGWRLDGYRAASA